MTVKVKTQKQLEKIRKEQEVAELMRVFMEPRTDEVRFTLLHQLRDRLRNEPSGASASQALNDAVEEKRIIAQHATWYWKEAEYLAYGLPAGDQHW